MLLTPGQTLSFYEILGPLGAGGMGEVWRARDTRLDREVAIKVVPEHFAEDEERLRRFEREAKVLASLNHPNVAGIHGVDQEGDTYFLALELVPGEDLAARLARGALPVDEALDVCRQIAEGLEAAHEAGVVHRDLKPANVRITPEGVVKLLDFGLAKPSGPAGGSGTTTTGRPDSFVVTEEGLVLGTPTYMSPEQARGKPVDKRTDVWAFGCVLYECLTGRRTFGGEALTDVLAAIVGLEPDLGVLPRETPARVRVLLARCLRKDPRKRLRDIGEARIVLEDPRTGDESAIESPPSSMRRSWIPWVLAASLAAALVALLLSQSPAGEGPGREPTRLQLAIRVPSPGLLPITTGGQEQQIVAISPDGSTVALVVADVEGRRLMVRRLEGEMRELEGTDGAGSPFFSPDGRWIGFFAHGELLKIPIVGGKPIPLCASDLDRGGAWGGDGRIVFAPSPTSPLFVVSENGGQPEPLTRLDAASHERTHRWPAFLTGGEEVLFTVGTTDSPSDYEDARIDAVSLATGERRTLLEGASMARASPSGHLLYSRDGDVHAVELTSIRKQPVDSVLVLRDVAGQRTSGVVYFDVAGNGTCVYAERDPRAAQYELAWLNRDDTFQPLPFPHRDYDLPRISPDGERVAVGIGRDGDVWIGDLETGALARLTFDEAAYAPVWSPDGARVAFATVRAEGVAIAWKAADGTNDASVLIQFEDRVPRAPLSFTPDGELLLYQQEGGLGRSSDLYYLSLQAGTSHPLEAGPRTEFGGALSPDGTHVVYATDETHGPEIYVQRFPSLEGRWQVSDWGVYARWSPDGREILFVKGRAVMSVTVATQPTFSHGAPREISRNLHLFHAFSDTLSNYDVAADGRLLVVRNTSEDSMDRHLNVAFRALDHLVPIGR